MGEFNIIWTGRHSDEAREKISHTASSELICNVYEILKRDMGTTQFYCSTCHTSIEYGESMPYKIVAAMHQNRISNVSLLVSCLPCAIQQGGPLTSMPVG